MKYFNASQILEALIQGEVLRRHIYSSMYQARSRGFPDREKIFKDALKAYDIYLENQK